MACKRESGTPESAAARASELQTLRDGDRYPEWPEGFYWSEAEGRPVWKSPQREDSRGDGSKATESLSPEPSRSLDLPHLERACELLWQHGHPAIAEALEREVKEALNG